MNCKIGDLAILINPQMEENLGVLFEVMAPWPDEPGYWRIRSLNGPHLTYSGERLEEGMASDSSLRPIRGVPAPEGSHESDKQPESAEALVAS